MKRSKMRQLKRTRALSSDFANARFRKKGANLKRSLLNLAHSPPESSSSSSPSEMDKWHKESSFYEEHYLSFLENIVSNTYQDIARKYDITFWEEFTVEFNKRIIAARPTNNPPIQTPFVPFTTMEVVDVGVLLRQKFKNYKQSGIDVPNSELLEKCFGCSRCPLPRFPTSLRGNMSDSSSIFKSRGRSRGRSCPGESSADTNSTTSEVSVISTIQNMYLGLNILEAEKAGQYINNNDFRSRFFLSLRTNEERTKYLKDLPPK